MFTIHLKTFERSGLIGLEFPMGQRLLALAIAGVLAWASLSGGPPAPLGLILSALFVLGALYDEQWAFDPAGQVFFRLGLIGFARQRRWTFEQVEELELTRFRTGVVPGVHEETQGYRRARRPYSVLAIRFTDGERRVLERRPRRQQQALEDAGSRIAAVTGLTFVVLQ